MKRFVLSVCIALSAVTAFSENDNRIVVEPTTGVSDCRLCKIKCMRFDNDVMLLDMKDGSTKSWNTDDVVRITFGLDNINTSLDLLSANGKFEFVGNELVIRNNAYQPVLLFDSNGKIVYTSSCCGRLVVDMSVYPAGMYLLNINGKVYKIVNR